MSIIIATMKKLSIISALTLALTLLVSTVNTSGAILITDSFGAVLRTDGNGLSIVSSGQNLVQPFGITTGNNNNVVYVSDLGSHAVFQIDPITGTQKTITTGGLLNVPFGIATEQNGNLLVVNAQYLLRINTNSKNGVQRILSSKGFFTAPIGVTVQDNDNILVLDAYNKVIQVNPKNGSQRLISQNGFMQSPQAITVSGNDIYVTDIVSGNFGVGRIIHIDLLTGIQNVLSEGNYLVGPVGITIATTGELLVADPYTINPDSINLFDGGIVIVNPNDGSQTLLARGQGNYVNPRG